MKFYKRFMGDIQAKTGHLSLAEFGAYDRLLDHCYSTEAPLPADLDACCRITRATSAAERKAVERVLGEFFDLTEQGYIQHRVLEMLAEAQPKIAANQRNGKLGGRPRRNPDGTQEKPNGSSGETQNEPNDNLSQSQIPTTDVVGKAPRKRSAPPAPPAVERPEDVAEQTWADWLALRKAKKAPVTETVVKAAKREAVEAGITLDAFLAIWCMRGSQGLHASWLQPHELQQARQRPPVQSFRAQDAQRAAQSLTVLAPGVVDRGLLPQSRGEIIEGGGGYVAAIEGR